METLLEKSCKIEKIPLLTSLGFLLPTIMYDNVPSIISVLLTSTVISSWCFWWNCEKDSLFQKIDSILARLSILTVIQYKVFFNTNNTLVFFSFVSLMLTSFLGSHICSNYSWNCRNHILFHTSAHIFGIISLVIAFPTYEIHIFYNA